MKENNYGQPSGFKMDGEFLLIGQKMELFNIGNIESRVLITVDRGNVMRFEIDIEKHYSCSSWRPEEGIAPNIKERSESGAGRFGDARVWRKIEVIRWGEGNNNGNYAQLYLKDNRLIFNKGDGVQEINYV